MIIYFITNLRVVWLEVIAGLYESRQEAPLSTILSVGIDRDQIGRILDFGNVMVRTYTVSIPLKNVAHPEQISAIIEEHWRRSMVISQKEDAAAMDKAIRAKLGLLPAEDANSALIQNRTMGLFCPETGVFPIHLSNIFQVRFDVGEVVTYRKHWFVLIEAIWLQIFLLFLAVGAALGRLFNLYTFLPADEVLSWRCS